jgi:hypothetical protein
MSQRPIDRPNDQATKRSTDQLTNKKSVKQADRPDSVQRCPLQGRAVTAIPLGRGSPTRLGATYPPAPRVTSMPAYLVLLRVEIARFTRDGAWPHLGWLPRSGLRPHLTEHLL